MLMLTVPVPKGAWATCDETPVKKYVKKIRQYNNNKNNINMINDAAFILLRGFLFPQFLLFVNQK